ncbi:Putative MCM3-associated protein [Penicillium brasilianum]|uniref:Putative MCM3-associated protein n=1 Tax=Penicillium brasilianum TaxID=104259 RepID=A0A0F7TUE9_PENBI|nr:Putative MCM3-associated protein [Penicillium brasilianum]
MASPFNPFVGRGQSAGEASTSGRGRGSTRESIRGGTDRGNKGVPRGRGRGGGRGRAIAGASAPRGRGAGAAARGASRAASSTSTSSTTTNVANSPFAQLTQPNQPNQLAAPQNVSGKQQARSKSPMAPGAGMRGGAAARNNTFSPGAAQHTSRQSPSVNGHGTSGKLTSADQTAMSGSYPDRYEQLKLDRAKQRQRAIRDGQMADPNQPTSLKKAIRPVGTCESMCPEFERVERIVQKMVDRSEKFLDPTTNTMENVEAKMLKRFRRSAAGYDEQLPSDIRTPKALLQATNYLIRHVVGGNEPLGIVHKFVWDRTRSIRNDFSVQQVTHEADVKVAVMCLERIARFHILSLHLLSSPANEEQFDRHQEREQLNNTMLSLMYYYDDNRGRMLFPNEEEFRAYYILFSIHDQRPDLEARVQKWPAALLNSPRVQVALDMYAAACNAWEYQGTLDSRRPNAIAQGFYTRFFHIIDSPSVSYLMACVAEIYFNHVRQTTIRAIWKAYCRAPASQQHKNEEWTVEQLTKVLYLDDDEQTIKFCEEQDLQFAENANGQMYLNWGARPVDSVGFSPSSEHAFSDTYVESKRAGRNLVAVILGMTIREAAAMGMIDESSVPERMDETPSEVPGAMGMIDESSVPGSMEESPSEVPTPVENTLFVSDKDNTTPAPTVEIVPTSLDSAFPTSASPAKNVFNPFQQTSQTPSPFGNHPQSIQPTAEAAPPQPANPFSAMFSGTPVNKAAETVPANPFAAKPSPSPSPFAFSTPAETTRAESAFTGPSTAFSGPGATEAANEGTPPASSPFSFPKPAETAEKADAPVTTSPFAFPKPTETAEESGATANTSPFAFPKPNGPIEKLTAPPTNSPFAFPKTAGTIEKEITPAASLNPFAASLSAFVPPKPLGLPEEVTAPEKALFPTTKANLATLKPSEVSTAEETSVPVSQPGEILSTAPSVTPKLFGPSPEPSAFSAFQNKKPLFPSSSPIASTNAVAEPSSNQEKEFGFPQIQLDLFAKPTKPKQGEATLPKLPLTDGPAKSPEPIEPALSVSQLDQSTTSLSSTQTSVDSDNLQWRPPQTEEEERALFKRIMRRAEEKAQRKEEKRKRKRVQEEQALSDSLREERLKASKLSTSEESLPPAKRFSLAESSIKALPTLPCLERARALLEKRPASAEPDTEVTRKRQREIDEDEMLLNSARIVAEQLRTGPKIFDDMSPQSLAEYNAYHAYWEERGKRSRSYSNSISPSITPYAQSASPPQFPRHPYEVAYAPDTPQGLGRTMSRTEYRIRMTGGHGLAYKPLDFSRLKSHKHLDKEKDKGKSRFAMSG